MKNGARSIVLLVGDLAMLLLAFAAMLHISFFNRLTSDILDIHLLPFSILIIIWVLIFFIFNLYNPQATRPNIPHLRQIFIAFIVAFAVSVIFFYTIPFFGITPKTNLFLFSGIALVLFIFWRRFFYIFFSSYFKKGVVFIVPKDINQAEVKELTDYVTASPQVGFSVLGHYNSMEEFEKMHTGKVPQVFIVSRDIWRGEENFKKLYEVKNEVLDLSYAYEDILNKISLDTIDESWFIHNIQSPEKNVYDWTKSFFNFIIALLVIIILLPLFLVIAICIKIYDGGPVFYSQNRVGKNGKNFKLYKFRSMIVNAENNGPEWSAKGDARVTLIGRVLRVLHIDELPQMFNILRGDITLVGPRPERPEFVAKLEHEIPFYHLRHIITPGFTGWAQIKFRYAGNVMDSKKKFEYDLYYLKNRNIFMDLGIFLRTIQIIFTH